MFNFFHSLSIGIVAAFMAFTGAFHSQSVVSTSTTNILATTTVQTTLSATTSAKEAKNNPLQSATVNTQTVVNVAIPQPVPNIPVSVPTPVIAQPVQPVQSQSIQTPSPADLLKEQETGFYNNLRELYTKLP